MLVKIGKCFERKRIFDEAFKHYDSAVKQDPTLAAATFRLGWLCVKDGRKKDEGIKMMRKTLGMDKGWIVKYLAVLGEILMR